MAANKYTRRKFLKTFAALSSTALVTGLNATCGSNPPAKVMYGPPPTGTAAVKSMYYWDSQSHQVALYDNQQVPLHTEFIIEFTAEVNMSSVSEHIVFIDSGKTAVSYDLISGSNWIIGISPKFYLLRNTTYTLRIRDGALDIKGERIDLANATAVFKTVA